MKQTLRFLVCTLMVSFGVGLLAGYAQAAEPELELQPLNDDRLTVPYSADREALGEEQAPLPRTQDEALSEELLRFLVEPSETLTDALIIYAI